MYETSFSTIESYRYTTVSFLLLSEEIKIYSLLYSAHTYTVMKGGRHSYRYIPLRELRSPDTQKREAAHSHNKICVRRLSVPVDPRTFTGTTIGPTGLQDVSFEYAIW